YPGRAVRHNTAVAEDHPEVAMTGDLAEVCHRSSSFCDYTVRPARDRRSRCSFRAVRDGTLSEEHTVVATRDLAEIHYLSGCGAEIFTTPGDRRVRRTASAICDTPAAQKLAPACDPAEIGHRPGGPLDIDAGNRRTGRTGRAIPYEAA